MITTVIPTFERSNMLVRALESALAQNIEGHRVCVHDNASCDDTEKIIREYCRKDNRVRYFRNPVNIGAQRNICNAVSAVETPYYSILSDDDFLLQGFYRSALDGLSKYPDAGFVCLKTVVADITNKRVDHRNKDWEDGYYFPSPKIARKMYGSHFVSTSVLFSQRVKEKLGPFDPSGSDSLYMTLASSVFSFVVLDKYGAVVTMHPQSYSMIGEGLNKEIISSLNSCFVESINVILNQDIDDDRKMFLIALYFNRLNQTYDTKRLMCHFGLKDDKLLGLIMDLPSFVSNRGVFDQMYRRSPLMFRSIVLLAYRFLHWVNVRKNKSVVGGWKYLSDETCHRLLAFDTNIHSLDLGL